MIHAFVTRRSITLVILTLLFAIPELSRAALVGDEAISFSWQSAGAGTDSMRGWSFSTNSDIEVTALGVFDHFNPNGLLGSHLVGIWDGNDDLVVSATVPGGTAADKIGQSRYVEIAPTLLASGQTYSIGAQYVGVANGDWFAHTFFSLDVDPAITVIEALSSVTTNFEIPAATGQPDPYLGPNFLMTAVPLPAGLPLMATALGLLLARRSRVASGR